LIHSEGWLELNHTQARGTSRLYRQSWLPDETVRAAILVVHGLGEHSSRYAYLARHCTDRGFAVHTLDHYGHGKSDGMPGFVERFSVYVDGLRGLLEDVRAVHDDVPLFLLGHSMGGLIAAAFLPEAQTEFRACALSGPLLQTDAEPPAIVLALVRLLSRLAPTLPLISLDATGVSRDPAVVNAYVNDPLVHHGKLSARLIVEMSHAMRDTMGSAPAVELPLLIMHGEDDVLTAPAGSREFFEHVSSADKTLNIYPGLYHEIFNEPERDQVLSDMTGWLEEHI